MSILELPVQVQVALITAVVGAITILVNIWIGTRNLNSQKQRRYIDTISNQRIEWLNNIREIFVEYTKCAAEIVMFQSIYLVHNLSAKDEKSKEFFQKIVKVNELKQKISLLLNPREFFSIKLNIFMEELVDLLLEANSNENQRKFKIINENIHYIQQVILKAEWKRILYEIEMGRKLEKEEVEKIFNDVAKDIDSEKFLELKTKPDF